MLIISIEKNENDTHTIESHNYILYNEQIPEGFIQVPTELKNKVIESMGYCDLILDEDNNLIDVELLEKPIIEEPEIPIDENRKILNAILGAK